MWVATFSGRGGFGLRPPDDLRGMAPSFLRWPARSRSGADPSSRPALVASPYGSVLSRAFVRRFGEESSQSCLLPQPRRWPGGFADAILLGRGGSRWDAYDRDGTRTIEVGSIPPRWDAYDRGGKRPSSM